MSIVRHAWTAEGPHITSPESMVEAIRRAGIIPFFENPIKGYSIEEMTPPEYWFDGEEDELGPWDWKIEAVRSGDIAYGKFLWGGKAAFATVDVFRELMNWRRSKTAYAPTTAQQRILDFVDEHGSVTVSEVRKLLGVKKSAADAQIGKLQMQTRLLTGDITRVYRGPELSYAGWQRSTFCTPESLFEELDFPFPGFKPRTLKSALTPDESFAFVKDCVRKVCGDVPDRLLYKMLA